MDDLAGLQAKLDAFDKLLLALKPFVPLPAQARLEQLRQMLQPFSQLQEMMEMMEVMSAMQDMNGMFGSPPDPGSEHNTENNN
ncbi:MAG: hypothetical protein LUE87_00645 [Lachnospiraceae bacterium]|nr:hypothetical protein [Lachnospiraceae bacterium]MCD8131017.1 hypothetical protein [Lachnospiraceae bacterium]